MAMHNSAPEDFVPKFENISIIWNFGGLLMYLRYVYFILFVDVYMEWTFYADVHCYTNCLKDVWRL